VLTVRKAGQVIRKETRVKRGSGAVCTEADLPLGADEDAEAGLAQAMGAEPTPELAAMVAEEYRRLLDRLGEDDLRAIAVWQMEGYSVEEIAKKLGRSERTVSRKLQVIRDRWRREELPS
jgi:DNA-directed RNA polymerase specialized sigma24 family protein